MKLQCPKCNREFIDTIETENIYYEGMCTLCSKLWCEDLLNNRDEDDN